MKNNTLIFAETIDRIIELYDKNLTLELKYVTRSYTIHYFGAHLHINES